MPPELCQWLARDAPPRLRRPSCWRRIQPIAGRWRYFLDTQFRCRLNLNYARVPAFRSSRQKNTVKKVYFGRQAKAAFRGPSHRVNYGFCCTSRSMIAQGYSWYTRTSTLYSSNSEYRVRFVLRVLKSIAVLAA